MAANLLAQAALEQAVVNALQTEPPTGLGFTPAQCHRMYDGQPPPSMGQWFVSVWGDNSRQTQSQRVHLSEVFSVFCTVTVRFTRPFDQWLVHRDFLEQQANAIRAIIVQDQWANSVINSANALAGFRNSGTGSTAAPVGFCESLAFAGFDPVLEKGADWFSAHPEKPMDGIAQTVKFAGARRVQAVTSATTVT
jgi:hypothetical protein